MAEHVRRVRRRRRVKRARSGRLQFTPARLAICAASLIAGFALGWVLLTSGPKAYRGWRESSLLKRALELMAKSGGKLKETVKVETSLEDIVTGMPRHAGQSSAAPAPLGTRATTETENTE